MTVRSNYCDPCHAVHPIEAVPPGHARSYDVAIIGAGVVGCAIARSFAVRGWSTLVVLEKAADILEGASKGNSALLHTGYDEPEGSEERADAAARASPSTAGIHARMNLPLVETGALVVAWSDRGRCASSPRSATSPDRNGTTDARIVAADELFEREPMSRPRRARRARRSPARPSSTPGARRSATCRRRSGTAPACHRRRAVRARARRGAAGGSPPRPGDFASRIVVNAAGLFGDRVERLRGAEPGFTIRPRKGQFIVFDKPARDLVSAILLRSRPSAPRACSSPRPSSATSSSDRPPRTRSTASTPPATRPCSARSAPRESGCCPPSPAQTVTACFAGLRPATEHRDYVLKVDPAGWVTVGGIRSTGLSAALGLGEWAADAGCRLLGEAPAAPPDDDLDWPRLPNLAASASRPYQSPGRGRSSATANG